MEGLITAPTVLRAAYAVTAAATGAFPVVPAEATATGALARSGPLARVTGELARLTGSFAALPGVPDRQESGLAALFAIASAAVASEGHTLDVATEVWRTGSFPAIPADATGPRKMPRPAAATSYDMLGGQAAPTVQTPSSRSATGDGSRRASTRSSRLPPRWFNRTMGMRNPVATAMDL